ncbi:MAG: STAS domain-containing protein, partial [Actinomycetota bacterium]
MAQLTITPRKAGDVTILDLIGKITMGEGAAQLRAEIHEQLNNGSVKLLLKLAGVSYVDNSGIGELVSSYTATSNRRGRLMLLNPNPKLLDLLAITHLIT